MHKKLILTKLIPVLAILFFGLTSKAQSGFTATLDATGLLKVTQALPESSSYSFDMKHLNSIQTAPQAQAFLKKYINAQFIDFQFDMAKKTGSMIIHCSKIMDAQPNLSSINHSLEMIFTYGN